MDVTRRGFLAATTALPQLSPVQVAPDPALPALAAEWIWYPEQRTLPCTFVLFRRVYELAVKPSQPVAAFVTGQSKYELLVNGRLVSRGPAPCDPRVLDIDPVDLMPHLQTGRNVIAAIVCMYGYGEGTWVPPEPAGNGAYGEGFLFEAPSLQWKTDSSWRASRTRAWKAGNYQRWYLRALQEEFDMRRWPDGWLTAEFDDSTWKAPRLSKPRWTPQLRSIPPVREERVPAARLVSSGFIDWKIDPDEYFECFTDDAFTETPAPLASEGALFPLALPSSGTRTLALTFDLGRELTGHPYVHVDAPAGTIVEMLFVEQQEPGKLLLRTCPRFGQWARLTTKAGLNTYETFEYDGLRYLQLLIRNANAPVKVLAAGVNAKSYQWPHACDLKISDEAVQRACNASLNTHHLTSIETMVDNQIRERQQYSGDLEHPKLASYYAHGEYRQAARMFRTFTLGQNPEGWFFDCWPANDRCQRLYQKHLGLTQWGPILDHSLQLGINLAEHYLFSGDRELLVEIFPRLQRYDAFLWNRRASDGLLPVEPWTWNSVWIDHVGYQSNQDKHAAFNLYYAGFLNLCIARIAGWLGLSTDAASRASRIVDAVRAQYWSKERSLFVDNLPRAKTPAEHRLHARTLSMAMLFGFSPEEEPSLRMLDTMQGIGMNYPLNEIWRLWALARGGRGDVIVRELRTRWANAPSVLANNTYAEFWEPKPSSSGNVWCQSNPVPIIAAYQLLLGLRPVAPGFAEYEVRPQPADLASIEATTHTPRGPIFLRAEGRRRGFTLTWRAPANTAGTLVVPSRSRVTGLPAGIRFEPGREPGTQRAPLPLASKEQQWLINVDFS